MVILNFAEFNLRQYYKICLLVLNNRTLIQLHSLIYIKMQIYIKLCKIHKINIVYCILLGCFHKIDFTPAVLAIDKLTHCNALRN